MILPMVPFREDRDLGRAYNEAIALLPADAWAICFDHDAMPTTRFWFSQFREAINFLPAAGAFVAMANRIGPAWQRCGPAGDDMREHRGFGAGRLAVRTLLDVSDTKGWGGVCFAVSKAMWRQVGGFVEGHLGCTDHDLHFKLQRAGRRSYVIEGLYVYHARISSESRPPVGMNAVPGCLCRGPEIVPTARLILP